MTPTVVLIKITSTTTTMINNNPTTLTPNSSAPLASNSTVVSSHFGVYQQTMIGSSEISTHKLVPVSISTEPYRKASMIPRRLSRLTSGLTRDLLRGRQKPRSPLFARIFLVSNLQVVGLENASGKPSQVPYSTHIPADFTYFIFRSVLSAPAIDGRVPKTFYLSNFCFVYP